jgi:peptidyl-prolyl cis-trans isomerase C
MLHFRTAAAALAGAGLIAAASVFALIAEPAAGRAQSAAEEPAGDVVVAKVDGETVHLSELMAAYGQLPAQAQQMGIEAVYPFLLDRVIDERLLGIAAAKAVPADDPELQEQMDQLRQRVTMQVYFNRELEEKVTEERIREGYDQFLKDNPPTEEVHAKSRAARISPKRRRNIPPGRAGRTAAISGISAPTRWSSPSRTPPSPCRPAMFRRRRCRPSSAGT